VDNCAFSTNPPIYEAQPDALALVVGVPPDRARKEPYVVLYTPTKDEPDFSIKLVAEEVPEIFAVDLNQTGCVDVDWKSYSLSVDPDQWYTYWEDARDSGFRIGAVVSDYVDPLELESIGFALLDSRTGQFLWSCGYYWE